MKVIITENIEGLGKKNSLVDVRPGYARNYLIPKGMAMEASSKTVAVFEEMLRQSAHKRAKIKQEAYDLSKRLETITIDVPVKADKNGKIFGSVTSIQLARILKVQGIELEKKDITIAKLIKNLGSHTATLKLHEDVECEIKLNVHSS